VLLHLVGGGGVHQASEYLEERLDLQRFAAGVHSYVKGQQGPVEVTLESVPEVTPPEPEREEAEPEVEPPTDRPEPPPPQPAERPIEPPVVKLEQKKEEERKPENVEELTQKKRISVRQHVEDENQEDNPDAEFLAEHNNRVREQTQARITSNTEDDPEPTPGSNDSGVGDQPGNAHETRVADNEDRPGEEGRPPSEEPAARQRKPSEIPPKAGAPDVAAATPPEAPRNPGDVRGVSKPGDDRTARATPEEPREAGAERETEERAEIVSSDHGTDAHPGAQQEQRRREAERPRRLPPRRVRGYEDLLGLGAAGTTRNGINLNLTPGLAQEAIGLDQLSRERLADGARRRSQHLGSWKTAGLERWRAAIENYVPSVRPGNQTALNTARAPFASYLAAIHNRLHPIFADWFLESLDALPAGHPMNRPDLRTNLEIVLDRAEGRIIRMGVTRTSGITAFDIAALDSAQRASPFGPPPREIVSPDGSVYLHWEFHRDPRIACTTYNARPYILKAQPKPAPAPTPEPPPDDRERHGALPSERKLGMRAQ